LLLLRARTWIWPQERGGNQKKVDGGNTTKGRDTFMLYCTALKKAEDKLMREEGGFEKNKPAVVKE